MVLNLVLVVPITVRIPLLHSTPLHCALQGLQAPTPVVLHIVPELTITIEVPEEVQREVEARTEVHGGTAGDHLADLFDWRWRCQTDQPILETR